MKSLLLLKATTGIAQVTPADMLALVRAGQEWVEARLGDGTLECGYNIPGNSGYTMMFVINSASAEELVEQLMASPLYRFFEIEVHPLSDLRHTFASLVKMVEGPTGA